MGKVTFFNETGIPHAGCYLEDDNAGTTEWLGFFPWAQGRWDDFLGGNGRILTLDRTDDIDWYVRYYVQDQPLRAARRDVIASYWTKIYQVGINDCVSFTRDFADAVGLDAPFPCFTPSGLITYLANNNTNYYYYSNDRPLKFLTS